MSSDGVYEHYTKDLDMLLEEKRSTHHQLVVMGDFNEDTRETGRLVKLMNKHQLYNPIEKKYGKGTTTYAHGDKPIDAIFISNTMKITKGGHKQGNLAMSDHKLIWIDIPKYEILGYTEPMIRPPYRKLQSSHPKVKKRYNKTLETQLQHHNVEKIIKKMTQAIKEANAEEYQKLYEKLDKIRMQCVKVAEKRCTKERRGHVAYSPELAVAIGAITMWKLIYKRATSKGTYRPRMRMLIRKAKRWKFKEEHLLCYHLPTIRNHLNSAIKHYRNIRKNADSMRTTFLEEKADAIAEERGVDKIKYLKHLIHTEEVKSTFQRIRHVQKPTSTTLTYIEKGPDEGPRERITEKEAMEAAIRIANVEKLTQANNTPLREEPLATLFKERTLDYETWETVLDPTTPLPDNLERGTTLWFRQMRKESSNIPEEPIKITVDKYRESWKKMKEATSSHPGLHFGHFKSMDNDSEIANKVHTVLANVPLQTGYSPREWQKCTNAMIKKKANDMRPGKLRLITLMHAVFNHNNKVVGKHMQALGEKHKQIAIEQYGSRKHKSAIDHALNKVLTLDISRQTREALVFTANDARSCYDRIVLMAAYCTMLKFGISKEAARSTITTLAKMAHYIRTAKGDSIRFYGGHTWVRIPHGIGQGNGAGPSIWACVSSPLFHALREDGYGMEFQSPVTLLVLNITGFSFVDDADLIQNMGDLNSEEDLFIKAQAQLKLWEQLLRTTGGAIEPSKSDWLYVRYKWKQGRWEYNRRKYPANLKVRNKDKEEEALVQLTTQEARETLGVWIAGDGNWRQQCTQLTGKATRWIDSLTKGHLTATETTIALPTTVMRSLEYCLPATTLTQKQCKQVMRKLLPRALPKMKVVRSINRDAVHLPKEYKGLGIKDLYTTQGIEHIKALIKHGGEDTATGILIQTTLEHHVLEVGSLTSIFQLPKIMIENMTQTWLKHTLLFMHTNKVTITNHQGSPNYWTTTDAGIMDILVEKDRYNKTDLQAINLCRMFMKVITMSDITTDDGRLIPAVKTMDQFNSTSSLAYAWPNQPIPSQRDIQLWHHALSLTIGLSTMNTSRYKHNGFNEKACTVQSWRYDETDDLVWEAQQHRWRQWKSHHTSRNKKYTATTTYRYFSHTHWKVAIISETDGDITLMHSTNRNIIVDTHLPPTWIPMGEFENDKIPTFLNKITDGSAGCVSDGSAKHGVTATAYTAMHEEDTLPAFKGSFGIPGRIKEQDSYRSELAGLLGIIMTVNFLCIIYNITKGKVTIGCDNKSALWTAFHTENITINRSSRDILQAIHHQRKLSTIEWQTKHVKGHQDDTNQELDDWEKANIEMDTNAKAEREQITEPIQHSFLPGEKWRLILGKTIVTGKYNKALERHCNYKRAVAYWSSRGQFDPDRHKHINWEAHHKAVTRLPNSIQVYLTKMYAGVHATGKVMHRRGEWSNATCPMCDQTEDHMHIIQCQSTQAKAHFLQAFCQLDDWLEKTTSLDIGQAIWLLLEDYRTQQTSINWLAWSPILQRTIDRQRLLGPRAFVEGYLTNDWIYAQDEHYLLTNNRKHSAGNWATTLNEKLFRFTHSMWKQRCNHLHKNTTQSTIHDNNYDADLALLLRHPPPPSMPAEDRKYFVPLATAISYNTQRKKRLINMLNTFNTSHELRTNTQSAQIMRQWLASYND